MDQLLLLAASIVVKIEFMELKLKNLFDKSGVAASRLHCGEAAPAGQGDQHRGQCLHQAHEQFLGIRQGIKHIKHLTWKINYFLNLGFL